MNIQTQKAIIIEQFQQVEDINLISAIKNMLDCASDKENEIFDIPISHQKIVTDRFEMVRANPERLMDWDEAKNMLPT